MLRTLAAVVVGIAAAMLTVMGIESVGHQLYPPPPGLDPQNREHLAAILAAAPLAAKAIVVAAWTIGAFAGGLATGVIAHTAGRFVQLLPGLLIAAGCIGMAMIVPHDRWMPAAGVVLALLGSGIGFSAGRRLRTPKPQFGEWKGGTR
jgi:MFS family permease